jgi:adenine deaminase
VLVPPLSTALSATAAAMPAGWVSAGCGTDAPNPGTSHGASIHRELELLVRSGLTPLEALASATSVPATIFHLDDRGMIAPGKRADLLLVRGDPTRDITATRDIVSVWKLGAEDDRASYRASIEKAKEEAVKTAQTPPSELGTGLSEISKKRASPLSLAPDGRSRATLLQVENPVWTNEDYGWRHRGR